MINSVGPKNSHDAITNVKSLKDRDLYVAVNDLSGKNLAHGGNPKMVGKDLAKEKGKGWIGAYKAVNPVTKKIQDKIVDSERVGDTLIVAGTCKIQCCCTGVRAPLSHRPA